MIVKTEAQRDAIIIKLLKLDVEKKWYRVDIAPYKANRTLSQNALLWVWLAALEEQTGAEPNHMYKYFESEFLPPVTFSVAGNEIKGTRLIKTLKVDRFNKLLDQIYKWLTENGVDVRWPNDSKFEEFCEHYKEKL